MPDLLEVIAENDTSVLNGWAAVFNERAPRMSELPEHERSREVQTLAREFTRRASWATETAEGWLTELKTRLRVGMGGHTFRDLLRSGRALCRMCQSVVVIARDVWRLAEESGAQADEAQAAGGVLAAAGQRLAAVEAEIDAFAKHAAPPSPEAIEKLFERADEQARRGKWLTPEQAHAAFLKTAE